MSADLISILALSGSFGALIAIIFFALRYEKKLRVKVATQYEALASKFGLKYTPGVKGSFLNYHYPTLTGRMDGTEIILYSYRTGGKNKVTYTVVELRDQQAIPDFRVIKDGLFQKIAKKFGGQDIKIGNPELDEKFRFICVDEARFIKAFDADMQQLLLHLHKKLLAPLNMKGGVMRYQFINHIHTDERREDFEMVFVLMLKIMKAMRP